MRLQRIQMGGIGPKLYWLVYYCHLVDIINNCQLACNKALCHCLDYMENVLWLV